MVEMIKFEIKNVDIIHDMMVNKNMNDCKREIDLK